MNFPVADILCAEVTPLSDDRLRQFWMERMPEERRNKVLAMRHAEGQRQSLGVGVLLFLALRERGLDAKCVNIREGEHGKPFLPDYPEIHFSLSHSGEWAICAIGGGPVGCDVEQIGRGTERLARRFFHPEEQAALAAVGDPREWSGLFTRIWTRKESLLKAKGTGLSEPLGSFSCLSPEPDIWYNDASPAPDLGYAAACCALGTIQPAFRWRMVDINDKP